MLLHSTRKKRDYSVYTKVGISKHSLAPFEGLRFAFAVMSVPRATKRPHSAERVFPQLWERGVTHFTTRYLLSLSLSLFRNGKDQNLKAHEAERNSWEGNSTNIDSAGCSVFVRGKPRSSGVCVGLQRVKGGAEESEELETVQLRYDGSSGSEGTDAGMGERNERGGIKEEKETTVELKSDGAQSNMKILDFIHLDKSLLFALLRGRQ